MNNLFKNLVIWLVIGLVLMTVFNQFNTRQATLVPMGLFPVLRGGQGRAHRRGADRGPQSQGQDHRWQDVTSYSPGDIWLISDLLKYGVKIKNHRC